MSYQIYKMLHIVSIVIYFSSYAVATAKRGSIKLEKILTGIALILILVSGFGLMARLGVSQGGSWPMWLKIKLGIWTVIGMSGHIILKRWAKFAPQFFWISIGLLILASYMANYKLT